MTSGNPTNNVVLNYVVYRIPPTRTKSIKIYSPLVVAKRLASRKISRINRTRTVGIRAAIIDRVIVNVVSTNLRYRISCIFLGYKHDACFLDSVDIVVSNYIIPGSNFDPVCTMRDTRLIGVTNAIILYKIQISRKTVKSYSSASPIQGCLIDRRRRYYIILISRNPSFSDNQIIPEYIMVTFCR